MEIEGEDGLKLALKNGTSTVFGRSLGFATNDRTVSRRHISFEVHSDTSQTEPRAFFQVIGKNPIWVRSKKSGEIRVYRRSDFGEIVAGDSLCLSGNNPVWFQLKKVETEARDREKDGIAIGEDDSAKGLQSGVDFESIDVSDIDPVREFGFLVKGHEFDQYPKQKIRDVKDWNWFLEELSEDSEDDEEGGNKKKTGNRRKRKKGKDYVDDDEWAGESEDDKEVVTKARKAEKPKYFTRSKDHNKPSKKSSSNEDASRNCNARADEQDVESETDEDTLGGFIVDDDDVELEEESDIDEEEEEEEEVDEEEDDDDE